MLPRATNYFRILGRSRREDVFPFDGESTDDTQRAWELAVARVRGDKTKICAYRDPRRFGTWSHHVRIIGGGFGEYAMPDRLLRDWLPDAAPGEGVTASPLGS